MLRDSLGYRMLAVPHDVISVDEARKFLEREYGIAHTTLTRIATERDDTFVVSQRGHARYLLKMENPSELYDAVLLRAQALEVLRVKAPDVPCTRMVNRGNTMGVTRYESASGTRWTTLTTFMPGRLLAKVPLPWSASLLQMMGSCLASIQMALASLKDINDDAERVLWDIRLLPEIADEVLPMIHDVQIDGCVRLAVDHYRYIEQEIVDLPQQLCHGDFHPGNLMVSSNGDERLMGIIDFGDMHSMPTICDLGTSLCYLVDETNRFKKPFAACSSMLAGYLRANTGFDRRQCSLLPIIMEARMALTLLLPVLTERMSGIDPGHYQTNPKDRLDRLKLMQSRVSEFEFECARILSRIGTAT